MYYTYAHYTADKSRLFYIGKGRRNRMSCKDSRSTYWHNIVNKHGLHVELLAQWKTEKEAFDHEKLLIECFKDLSNLCNLTAGGEGCSGYKWTKEQLEKAKKRKPHNLGKKVPEDIKRKMSELQKGVKKGPQTKEHSQKISLALKNVKKSKEHIEKLIVKRKEQALVKKTCPHCGFVGNGVNIYKWHFNRCQKKD
jgi:hypothetical protein